jgi:hypothetical protein
MGDIVGSQTYKARPLRDEFMNLISSCNDAFSQTILSPYTITLGDEFQGVPESLDSMLDTIFYLEETRLRRGLAFRMRYVGVHGEIDTDINTLRAHSMMGSGLTQARKLLIDKRRGQARIRFRLRNCGLTNQLNRLFLALDGLTGRWDTDDGALILDMLADPNNSNVGRMHEKDRSLIWRRRKTLLVEEYRALKEAILSLGDGKV